MTFLEYIFIEKTAISTHTLTWSVTQVKTFFAGGLVISTHTLTWSVTIRRYLI